MYNEVKNFTSNLFLDLISLIDQAYDNYTLLLKEIKAKKSISFEKIKEIIKNEYIEYINLSMYHLRLFSNFTLNYLDEISSLINTINDIQIDILYDIIDNIEGSKNIFKNFCKLLFNSIENGIKLFKYDLEDHIESVIGELLYITEFISNGLENDEILKNSLEEKVKSDTIFKLKNFKNIINIIINQLVEEILSDYKDQMLYSNNNSIKFQTEKESSEFLSKIKNNSENLIETIKIKIKYIEKYEEYYSNIEKINKISYNMINNLINNKKNLFEVSVKIKNEINNEINEINNFIEKYSEKYKDENIYNLHLNLYNFSKSFTDEKMNILLNDFFSLIDKTIDIKITSIIKKNYDLGFEYLQDEKDLFYTYRDGTWGTGDSTVKFLGIDLRRQHITSTFMEKYQKFVLNFQTFLSSVLYSNEFINIFEYYFYGMKEEIINYVQNKLLDINGYYFINDENENNSSYKHYFYFITQIKNEILKIIDIINKYFSETTFELKIYNYIIMTASNKLIDFDKPLREQFSKEFQSLYTKTNDIKQTDKDFCWSKWKPFKWKPTCLYSEHSNNIYKITKNLEPIKKYVEENKNQIFNKFINQFSENLEKCINISNTLFVNLYSYTEEKINNNQNINILLKEYSNILNYMNLNNSNKNLLLNLHNKQKENINNNVEQMIDDLKKDSEKINNEFYYYYYQTNKTNYLEYPYELIIKCNQIINELQNNTKYLKYSINSLYQTKLMNIIKETNKFIINENNNNYLYIKSHLNYSSIIPYFIDKKTKILNEFFINCENNLDHSNNEIISNMSEINDYLDFINYDNKIKSIIKYVENFTKILNETINKEFTEVICENFSNISDIKEGDNNSNNINILDENDTDIKCNITYYESDLNYSKYNFQIVKIRNTIFNLKYLYEELDNIYIDFQLNENYFHQKILNITYLNEKDDKVNDKGIWSIYNESLNSKEYIKNEAKMFLKNYYDFFLENFINKYSINNKINSQIFLENLKIFNEILNNNYTSYNNKLIMI